jgi:1-acyl-sn-glycerol-3-phosphate acyltransferase
MGHEKPTAEGQANFVLFDATRARPAPGGGIMAGFARLLCSVYLKLGGWKLRGDWPEGVRKCVLLAAPHTSNWDGLNMLAAAGFYRVKLRWMGKKSLVQNPFGFIVRWSGIVPVDRSAAHDVVTHMKRAFAEEDWLVLAIAPEGTRERVKAWKRGYYHIARGADVPVVISVLDYGTKTITLAGMFHPTGDYDADFQWVKARYESAQGKFPEKFSLDP